MKLIKFSIKNFRSIHNAPDIPISDSTILIGKNNEGKSNILKALLVSMTLLRDHSKRRRINISRGTRLNEEYYYWERDFPIQLQTIDRKGYTIFRLEFELNPDDITEFRSKINSTTNGILPLEIKIGSDNIAIFKVPKRGKSTVLSKKSASISEYIASKININYIPAVRTNDDAIDVIKNMLSTELQVLENDPEYLKAVQIITDSQRPLLDKLGHRIKDSLSDFLPNIKEVTLNIEDDERKFALRRGLQVIIDDGTPTNIDFKGDGIKSLVALALLKNRSIGSGISIIAIEEPETHLHPSAIHALNEVINSLSNENQVILTTHNPLFVNREFLKNNIIVDLGKAAPAKSLKKIRDLLGIKASDNLLNASYVLVVEGEDDAIALNSILPTLSEKLKRALKSNLLVIDYIGGAGNLSYKLTLHKMSLCKYHVLLDNDEAGRKAFSDAMTAKLLDIKNTTMITCNGMTNSEFEDCLSIDIYSEQIKQEYGVDLSIKFKGNQKWSSRIKDSFLVHGKPFSENVLKQVKLTVAYAVSKNPEDSLLTHKRNSIDALVKSLETLTEQM